MARFSDEALKTVKAAVADVESRTAGEVVPVLLPASSDYGWVKFALFVKGSLLSFLIIEAISLLSSWPLPWDFTFGLTALGGVLAACLSLIPAVTRWMVGAERLNESVQTRARSLFIEYGVTETKDRTGVLILVSKLEREIVILADRGIHEKVSRDFWPSLCEKFVHEIHAGREVEGLVTIIRKAGEPLAEHFPRQAGDVNELSDELRGAAPITPVKGDRS